MKERTKEEQRAIERKINNLIMEHNKREICELCKIDDYALCYFIEKAINEISNIINNK